MSVVDPAWRQEEQHDQPTADELPENEDWPIDDYIEGLLSAPELDDPGSDDDLTTDDFADDW